MKKILIFGAVAFLLGVSCSSRDQTKSKLTQVALKDSVPDCEWCGAMDAPNELDWKARIASVNEPGEPLVLSGTIYQAEGTSPASGVLVYAYHTNAEGDYPKRGDETGNGQRHGYLRAWVKTNAMGQYEFTTIKPAPYPSHEEPAHIHMTLSAKGVPEYWLDAIWFAGDPLITPELKARVTRTGGSSNIIDLSQDQNGVWIGQKDFILGKY